MYLFVKEMSNRVTGFVGALIYLYTPYRAVDLYVRGALGECFSFVFFPLVALLVLKIIKKSKWLDVGLMGLTTGLFILSHNLAPLFFLPWIFIFSLIYITQNKDRKALIKVIVGLVLGFCSSAYFWLPALLEKNLVASGTPFNYFDHFPFIKQLIFPSWGYGASVWGPTDQLSFQIGIVNLILFLLLIFNLARLIFSKEKLAIKPIFFLASILAFVFLMNIRSQPLWEISGISNYLQFPWRLLMLTTFTTSSLVIFVKRKWVLFALCLMSMFLTLNYFKPSEYFKPDDDYFLHRFFANQSISGQTDTISEEYKNHSEDYLPLPMWVEERPNSYPEAKFQSNTFTIQSIKEINTVNYETQVVGDSSGTVEYNAYYFPGWRVLVDGTMTEPEVSKPRGNMAINLSRGTHTIQVFWTETNLRKFVDIISIFSLALILYLVFKEKKLWIRK